MLKPTLLLVNILSYHYLDRKGHSKLFNLYSGIIKATVCHNTSHGSDGLNNIML